MWRYVAGLVGGALLIAGSVLWWKNAAIARHPLPDAPVAEAQAPTDDRAPTPEPPAASEKTREERRLSRIDHDKNGQVSRDEFLAMRRRNFDKLDRDHDGRLSFDEYATKAVERFAVADKDKSQALTAVEFATTRIVRKADATRCPLPRRANEEDDG